ncbi:hypothetical protein [Serinicoccus kebangsaanensis]|uniref:hypothetical protein n=1 Tax=Serinicoccus kebangsaanensis TaxID=2602069 RepID=UPI00124C5DDE|nr:hypothetical protein [Serinicoccus kebangsaanensis]
MTDPARSHVPGGPQDRGGALLAELGEVAAQRSRAERRLLEVARELVAATGETLLGQKGFSSVEELTAAERRRWRAEAKRLCVAEIRLRLGVGEREARAMTGLACAPADVRDQVLGALGRGEVTWSLVRGFWQRCGPLPAERAGLVAEVLFGTDPSTAAPERLDPDGDLRTEPWQHTDYWATLEREAVRAEGEDVQAERERRRAACRRRRSWMSVHDDGTATMSITGPLTTMAAIHARVERAARALRKAGDERTLDQLRSDVPAALLLHGELPLPQRVSEDDVTVADLEAISRIVSAQPRVDLQVVVPWGAFTADDEQPSQPARCDRRLGSVGHVLGHHPAFISPGHARELALLPGTTLSRLLVDPADGRLVERTIARYRPDADMRRQVVAADVHSRSPLTRVPASRCELDHVLPHGTPGGLTGEHNLGSLDIRTHQFKTARTWSVAINRRRDLTWSTLLGQTATTRVHDYRQYLDRAFATTPPGEPSGDHGAHDTADTRGTIDARRDLACQALYAALVHRGADAFLSDLDDDADDRTPLTGWACVARRSPGEPVPTPEEVLGIPAGDDLDRAARRAHPDAERRGKDRPGDPAGGGWPTRPDGPPPF